MYQTLVCGKTARKERSRVSEVGALDAVGRDPGGRQAAGGQAVP